jgi:hypothetical protein
MDYVIAAPEYVAQAATDLGNIGSTLGDANLAALAPTSGVLPAGSDSVSTLIAELFSAHAQAYQELSAQANLFHQQFVQLMNSGANAYQYAEAANVSPLQPVEQALLGAIGAPGGTSAPAPAASPLLTSSVANGYTMAATPTTAGPAAPAASAAPIGPASRVAGVLYGQGGTGGAVAGPSGNAVTAAATGENAELMAASEPAANAAAAQPPLMYGPNSGASSRNSFGQTGGFRGASYGAEVREGEPA